MLRPGAARCGRMAGADWLNLSPVFAAARLAGSVGRSGWMRPCGSSPSPLQDNPRRSLITGGIFI
ncbi:MAG: hypothetical protein BGO12_19700 [Verrucomicrobia bacterium 61-8]|nr:MAG: hypothetical protein BGO12_19700 [Verrucomicrobia bacterium 61-8]